MFTNLCLVLLLVRADSLIPKFQFQLMKKTGEKSWKWWKFVFTWHFENKMLNARIWRRKAAKSTGTWRLLGVTAPWNSVAVKEPAFHSSPRKEIKASSQLFTRRADNAISEACVTAMTGYHLDELVMICINFNGYTSLFFFCLLLFFFILPIFYSSLAFNTRIYKLYECKLWSNFITVYKLTIWLSVKTFRTRTVHFVFSLVIFVSAHVMIPLVRDFADTVFKWVPG